MNALCFFICVSVYYKAKFLIGHFFMIVSSFSTKYNSKNMKKYTFMPEGTV